MLPLLNLYARVPVCGLIAQYNDTETPEGPDRLPGFFTRVLVKSLTIRGFIQREFVSEMYADFQRDVSGWIREGRFAYREDIVDGLGECARGVHRSAPGQQLRQAGGPGRRGELTDRIRPGQGAVVIQR